MGTSPSARASGAGPAIRSPAPRPRHRDGGGLSSGPSSASTTRRGTILLAYFTVEGSGRGTDDRGSGDRGLPRRGRRVALRASRGAAAPIAHPDQPNGTGAGTPDRGPVVRTVQPAGTPDSARRADARRTAPGLPAPPRGAGRCPALGRCSASGGAADRLLQLAARNHRRHVDGRVHCRASRRHSGPLCLPGHAAPPVVRPAPPRRLRGLVSRRTTHAGPAPGRFGPTIAHEPRSVLVRRDHPLARRDRVDIEELAEHELLHPPTITEQFTDAWTPRSPRPGAPCAGSTVRPAATWRR